MEYNLIRSSHRSIARRPARHIFSSACRGFSRIGTGHRLLFRAEKRGGSQAGLRCSSENAGRGDQSHFGLATK